MIARVVAVAVLAAAFGSVAGGSAGGSCIAAAQPAGGTAGVIIEYDEVHRDEFCVPVVQGALALDALAQTGVELTVQDHGGDRVTICRVGGVGCDRDDCFCACRDADQGCTFWGVYTLTRDASWRFAQVGVGELRVRPGDVLGLRWAVQTSDGGAVPVTELPQGVCARVAVAGDAGARDDGGRAGPGLGVVVVLGILVVLVGAAWWGRRT